jgi:uncharacterized membrane protein
MPPDITLLDWIALIWFGLVVAGYGRLADRVPGQPIALNHRMAALRTHWMTRMMERDVRIMDTQLIGHTIHSVTFFASTTMLVLAGLLGMFGAADRVYEVMSEISFSVRTSKGFFEAKMLLLIGLFVHGFFKFTWSLRQYNYLCAMIGSAPAAPLAPARAAPYADACARLLTEAVVSFNAGMRAYYFALAALAWFIQPWLFLALTTWMLAVLLNRQMRSRSAAAIEDQLRSLAAPDRPEGGGG